jgi:hypothetical protein
MAGREEQGGASPVIGWKADGHVLFILDSGSVRLRVIEAFAFRSVLTFEESGALRLEQFLNDFAFEVLTAVSVERVKSLSVVIYHVVRREPDDVFRWKILYPSSGSKSK